MTAQPTVVHGSSLEPLRACRTNLSLPGLQCWFDVKSEGGAGKGEKSDESLERRSASKTIRTNGQIPARAVGAQVLF